MNTLHAVSPEKVMALLDGELSAAEAKIVSLHVERCSECTRVSEQLRNTSRVLSAWTVPGLPNEVEVRIQDALGKKNLGGKLGTASLGSRFPRWKRWAFVSAGTVAALPLMLTLFGPRYSSVRESETVAYQGAPGGEGHGSLGRLIGHIPSNTDQRSKIFGPRDSAEMAKGYAKDSNGPLRGLGDHARDSFSVDGQLRADQASEGSQAPMIARTVSLSIVVKDFAASRAALDAVLKRHHGYAAQLSVSTPENAPRSLQGSLRVPAPELASAVSDIKALGRVENEAQSGEEVTRQHADLVSRLRTARETEQRFRGILQQRTGNVAEVLQVEEGIARVRGDIERMEAEQKALEHRVDFSTIKLQLGEEYKAQLNPPAASVATRMHNAFVAGYHNASETVLGIILFFEEYGPTLLIWLVILVLPIIVLWKRYRKGMATV